MLLHEDSDSLKAAAVAAALRVADLLYAPLLEQVLHLSSEVLQRGPTQEEEAVLDLHFPLQPHLGAGGSEGTVWGGGGVGVGVWGGGDYTI